MASDKKHKVTVRAPRPHFRGGHFIPDEDIEIEVTDEQLEQLRGDTTVFLRELAKPEPKPEPTKPPKA